MPDGSVSADASQLNRQRCRYAEPLCICKSKAGRKVVVKNRLVKVSDDIDIEHRKVRS